MHCGGADVAEGGGGVATLPGGGGGGGGGPQAAARRHSPQPSLPLATHRSGPVDCTYFSVSSSQCLTFLIRYISQCSPCLCFGQGLVSFLPLLAAIK